MLIDYVSEDLSLIEKLREYVADGIIEEVDSNLSNYIFQADKEGNRLILSKDFPLKGDVTNAPYKVKSDDTIYLTVTKVNHKLEKHAKCIYSNELIRKYKLNNIQQIKIIFKETQNFKLLMDTYLSFKNRISTLKKNGTLKMEILNHMIEFELSTMNFMKHSICNNGVKLNVNIHDGERWKEILGYKNFDSEMLSGFYSHLIDFHIYFIDEKYLDNYIVIGKSKYLYNQMLFNLVTHSLEHLEEMENQV